MRDLLPNGMLGVAIAGLLASFMAGMAANISAFNTVFTYDLWQTYVKKDQPDDYYTRVGPAGDRGGDASSPSARRSFAANYSNIMDYLQTLFGFFNAPLFATFILGMFWKRMTPTAGWTGLVSGTLAAVLVGVLSKDALGPMSVGAVGLTGPGRELRGGGCGVRGRHRGQRGGQPVTSPKPESELRGLVYSLTPKADFHDPSEGRAAWYQQPTKLAGVGAVLVIVLNIIFW